MGFIKAITGAVGSTFGDQWLDYYKPSSEITPTSVFFPAVPSNTNAGRGVNGNGSQNIISNGSKVLVPEGTALITMQDGQITGFVAEAGGYIFKSDDPNSKSFLAGDGILASTVKESWERFKFGGQPGSEQLAFYVNLKEITGIRFGTSEIFYWNDSYLELKAGGMARGTYNIKIVDPILFVKNYVPIEYQRSSSSAFDLNDPLNKTSESLMLEFVNSLSGAVSKLSILARQQNIDTMDYIQMYKDEVNNAMAAETENTYHWLANRGIKLLASTLTLTYDEKTQAVLDEIRTQDINLRGARRMGDAYSNNMAGMVAADSGAAMKAAASNENGAMMGFMGMNLASMQANNIMGAASNMQQPSVQPQQVQPDASVTSQPQQPSDEQPVDPYAKLTEMKKLLDAGVITQADFDAVKNKILGI